ncbi:MAG TPA: hypothetical protein PK388_02295 [Kiritimatiellia bacterium]|nr:hypothetical protein [Kiritimatiellia bacterium]
MSNATDKGRRAGWLAATLAAAALFLAAPAGAEPYVYVARAHLVGVERSFAAASTAPLSGAGVRVFQEPEAESDGAERFDVRWYANPPGIPPGAVLLLETVHEGSPIVRNHVLRTTGKSEGHVRSVLEIPAAEVRREGRVAQWRVRIVWRGRVLDAQASPNWIG